MSEKYVQLFEEFNPNKAKEKLQKQVDAVKKRIKANQDNFAKTAKSKDSFRQEILKNKVEIENLNLKKIELQNKIIDLRVKRKKEIIAKLNKNN